MEEVKYVIKECCDNKAIFYRYSHGLGFNANCYMNKVEMMKAHKYAFKTRSGAEKAIPLIKRDCACPLIDTINYRHTHTRKETLQWLDQQVKNTDWDKSEFSFTIITLNEMLDEVKYDKVAKTVS